MPDTTLAPTSAAPDAPSPATSSEATEDAIQSVLRDTLPPSTDGAASTETPAEAYAPVQGEDGRWRHPDGTFAPAPGEAPAAAATEAAPATQASAAEEPAAPVLPDGVIMPSAVARPLATEFTLAAPDGTELAVPDVMVTFKANGKDRTEPLDKVVKLAQIGYYNHEREQSIVTAQQETATVRGEAEQLRIYAQQLEQRYLAVLTDDNAYLADREAVLAEQTPERQLARERERIDQERRSLEQSRTAAQAEAFVGGELATAIGTIAQHHDLVSEEEIAAKLSTDLHLFTRNGVVPPESYEAVRRHVVQAVLPWVREMQAVRTERFAPRLRQNADELARVKAAAEKAEADKARAQVEAQKAKRNQARAATPAGRAAAGSSPPPAKVITTASDALEDAIGSVLRETLHQGAAA